MDMGEPVYVYGRKRVLIWGGRCTTVGSSRCKRQNQIRNISMVYAYGKFPPFVGVRAWDAAAQGYGVRAWEMVSASFCCSARRRLFSIVKALVTPINGRKFVRRLI